MGGDQGVTICFYTVISLIDKGLPAGMLERMWLSIAPTVGCCEKHSAKQMSVPESSVT